MLMLNARSFVTLLTTSTLAAPASAAADDGDWISNWSTPRELLSAFDVDPQDPRSMTMIRGSGDIIISNGIAKFHGSPRLYISQVDGVDGWENVEMTAYGNYVDVGSSPMAYAGLTMGTRTNHDIYKDDACGAFGYYARIYQDTGECAFQKVCSIML